MNTETTLLENVINISSGLLTPLIAILAVWIAYQQMKSNRDKVRIDLFEKRMKIFSVIRECLGKILADGSSREIDWKDFYYAIEQSKFLLDDELQNYLTEIELKLRDLFRTDVLLYGAGGNGGIPTGEQRNKIADENSKILSWLTNQLEPLEKKFAKFMKMNKI